MQKGEHFRSRIIFCETMASLRNDIQFSNNNDSNHQTQISPIQDLGIGMVSQFVLDYMHLVCLGVVRRLINLWVPSRGSGVLSMNIANVISDDLLSLKRLLPSEFSRKPRSLFEFRQWKATEFRQFLLYTGPVVLKGRLTQALYKNFMLLSVAIRILLNDASNSEILCLC